MILNFITLTNDAERIPKWKCEEGTALKKTACFIHTDSFPKRIMMLGPNSSEGYIPTEPEEVSKGVYVSKMELPYLNISVSGSDLRPYIETYSPNIACHKQVVIIQIDRTAYQYLDSGANNFAKSNGVGDSIILNTFHSKEWIGCIAVIGNDFERGNYNPPRNVGMYIDYAVIGEERSKMLREMHLTDTDSGLEINDGLVEGGRIAKNLMDVYESKKRRSFRIKTTQRLSNIIVVPKSEENAKEIFDNAASFYLQNAYDIKIFYVDVDEEGNVVESSAKDLTNLLKLLKKEKGNRNRSAIFYNCRPTKMFFEVNLSYIFVGRPLDSSKEDGPISYLSVICP